MILIHVCCADCLLKFIKSVKQKLKINKENIVLFYYNPNIHPRSEYLARLDALKKTVTDLQIKLIIPNWQPKDYFKRLEKIKKKISDKKIRCFYCWSLRLESTFKYAKDNGFNKVSTTLSVSKYQNVNEIKTIGKKLEKKYKIQFFVPKEIICDLKIGGFYKQNYCGCIYSLIERMEEKYS